MVWYHTRHVTYGSQKNIIICSCLIGCSDYLTFHESLSGSANLVVQHHVVVNKARRGIHKKIDIDCATTYYYSSYIPVGG